MVSPAVAAPLHLKLEPCSVLIAIGVAVIVIILNTSLNPLVLVDESCQRW
mgnify:FL=1